MACMDSVSAAIVMKLEQSRAELHQTRSATAQVYPQLCAVYKATVRVLYNPVRSFGIQGTCASRQAATTRKRSTSGQTAPYHNSGSYSYVSGLLR